jgi:MFS family permease
VFALGGAKVSYTLMLTGRGIFGLGGECMSVSQSAIISQWFKGKELSFAFGVTLCVARCGSYINGLALPKVAEQFPDSEPVKQIAYGLFLGFAICCLSWLMAILLACVDAYADRVEGNKVIKLTDEEKFHFRYLKKFERPYWLLVASCALIYCVLFPYLSNLGVSMLEIKYCYDTTSAGSTNFLPYLISAFLCAPMGFLIDRIGRRALFSK